MTKYILGIDGGQTSTKLLAATTSGEVIWTSRAESAFSGAKEEFAAGVRANLSQVLRQALTKLPLADQSFEIVVLGMSGAEPGSPLVLLFELAAKEAVRAESVVVVHDALTNLLGASAGRPGIVVIAGGGAVAYGVAEDGRSWSCSGWGYIIGDEGSAYSIGRNAINALFHARDKRGPETSLTGDILSRFQIKSEVELKYAIFGGQVSFCDIAELAPVVSQAAREGDGPARDILRSAGHELGRTAIAVARAMEMERPDIYPTGGLFHETEYLTPSFREAILSMLPGARICQPCLEPVVGTFFVALRHLHQDPSPAVVQRLTESWRKLSQNAEIG